MKGLTPFQITEAQSLTLYLSMLNSLYNVTIVCLCFFIMEDSLILVTSYWLLTYDAFIRIALWYIYILLPYITVSVHKSQATETKATAKIMHWFCEDLYWMASSKFPLVVATLMLTFFISRYPVLDVGSILLKTEDLRHCHPKDGTFFNISKVTVSVCTGLEFTSFGYQLDVKWLPIHTA